MIAQDPSIKPTAEYDTFGRSLDSLDTRNRDVEYVTGVQFQAYTEGNAVGNYNIRDISAGKISAGTITVQLGVGTTGTGYVRIDGANNNIIVNDGTTDRIIIGYQANGF